MFIHYSCFRVLNDYIHSCASHLSGGLGALQLCCLQQVTEFFSFKLHRVESQVLQRQLAWPGDSWKGSLHLLWGCWCSAPQLQSPPSVTEPCGCCSASQGNKAIEPRALLFQHQAPSAVASRENVPGQGWSVCGTAHWDTGSDTQGAPGGFISLLGGLRAATI